MVVVGVSEALRTSVDKWNWVGHVVNLHKHGKNIKMSRGKATRPLEAVYSMSHDPLPSPARPKGTRCSTKSLCVDFSHSDMTNSDSNSVEHLGTRLGNQHEQLAREDGRFRRESPLDQIIGNKSKKRKLCVR